MSYSRTWQDKILVPSAAMKGESISDSVDTSDKQLVGLVLAGDEGAFEEIFERYKRLVASVAGRYLRRPEQVEEVIQITFAKMYFELKGFRGLHDLSLAGWLSRIATNASIDVLRSQKRRPEDLVCELSGSANADFIAVTGAHDSEEQYHVDRDLADKLLLRLAPEDRVLLQMIYVEGLSVAEAARVLGWAAPKTKLRAWRARKSLRKTLKRLL